MKIPLSSQLLDANLCGSKTICRLPCAALHAQISPRPCSVALDEADSQSQSSVSCAEEMELTAWLSCSQEPSEDEQAHMNNSETS